jgi:hypothetical protein
MNTLQQVLDQYVRHIVRLTKKAPSHSRSKGIAYYMAAVITVRHLMNAPIPAWVLVQFKKRSAFD